MPLPLIPLAAGAGGLYLLQQLLGGSSEPTPTPTAPRAPNVGQQSQRVAATGVENNIPLPPPSPPPVQRTAPVATPGEAAAPAPAETATNEDAMERLRALQANNPQAAEPTDDPDADRNRRLAQFGFAMAASRNPSLFGMIGEAGLAMQRGNREEREDDRRDREVDTQAEYRQAQIALARAEALYNQDPNNPRNQALLAQARYAAARAARGVGGGGSANEGPGVPVMQNGLYGVFYPRTGRLVTAPEGVLPVGANANTPEERRYTDWQNRRASAAQAIVTDPIAGSNPQVAETRMQAWLRLNPEPQISRGGQGAAPAAPAASSNVRIPYTPPR